MKKNYILLIVLLLFTVLITLGFSYFYKNKNNSDSEFYNYSNKIKPDDFEIYIIENPSSIIYIADKKDLSNEKFEKDFKTKIDELNLKDKLVYIDKNEINNDFIKNMKDKYNIDINKFPLVIILLDNDIECIYIDENTDAATFIDYGVFK